MEYPCLQDISLIRSPRDIKLNSENIHIGHGPTNSVIINNIGISPEHCTVQRNQNGDWVFINKSRNGTQINGVKLLKNQKHNLKQGDILSLGYVLTYVFKLPGCSLSVTNPLSDIKKAGPLTDFTGSGRKRGHSTDSNSNNNDSKKMKLDDPLLDATHDELQCIVCTEMFVEAQTLSCSHTFCKYCIQQWRRNQNSCPICRKQIKTLSPTLVLDNIIQNIIENSTKEIQDYRRAVIDARKSVASPKRRNNNRRRR